MKIRTVLLLGSLMIFACKSDDPLVPINTYGDGILVSNEGPFNNGTGTVSFIDRELETVANGIYSQVNDSPLGNIVQSIGFEGDRAYIVANSAGG